MALKNSSIMDLPIPFQSELILLNSRYFLFLILLISSNHKIHHNDSTYRRPLNISLILLYTKHYLNFVHC